MGSCVAGGPAPAIPVLQIARHRGMKKAIVALARRLAVIMHRMWVDGTNFRWTREVAAARTFGRFSNRPIKVKRFQTILRHGVDVAHGLALLSGLGTEALPSWDSKTRWNNLLGGLAVNVTAGSSRHTNSPHPSSREGHHSTVGWI